MIAAEEYGRALFTLAKEEGEDAVKAYHQTLEQIDNLLRTQPEYQKLLDTPAIGTEEKLGLIDKAFGECEQNILNFIKILCEKHALYRLHDCFLAYRKLFREEYAITEASCVTAHPMTEEQKTALCEKLCRVTGKEVLLTCRVDPSLVGGIVLLVDGKQLDGSVKARLDSFRKSLAETIV